MRIMKTEEMLQWGGLFFLFLAAVFLLLASMA